VGRLRFVGYLDDEAGQVHQLVHRWQVALPLHAEYGTQPNVFYVPPLPGPPRFDAQGKAIAGSERIPLASLQELFGPGVKKALATLEAEMKKKKAGAGSALMDMLIAFKQEELFRLGPPADGGLVGLGRRGIRSVDGGGR
jgi:complex iron-sulfur molybdoenzyme family reductase subunit beta